MTVFILVTKFKENSTLPFEKGLIKEGLREGFWETYHDNSILQQASYYMQGKLQGQSTTYIADGNVLAEGSFRNGRKEGEWHWYYGSGLLQCSVYFADDQKEAA